MIDEPKVEPKHVIFPPSAILFAHIYKAISFYQDQREQFSFVLDFKSGKIGYSEGSDTLLPYVYESPRFGPQLRLKSYFRPPVLTPGQPAAGLASMINVLDSQNRKRDDVFKCVEQINVAVRPWTQIAHYGPHRGELIIGLGIDHVDLYGLKPENLGL